MNRHLAMPIRLATIALLAMGVLLPIGDAVAVPVEYLFEGVGSGTVGGQGFTDASFQVAVVGDTDDVQQFSNLAIHEGLAATIAIDGFSTATFDEDLRIFNNRQIEVVGVGAAVQGDLIDIEDQLGVGLDVYDLTDSFGPITTLDPFFSQFSGVDTDQGQVSFSDMTRVTYTATVVPEPTAALLLALSTCLLWTKRRRV